MDLINKLKERCEVLQKSHDELGDLLSNLSEEILINDLSTEFRHNLANGINKGILKYGIDEIKIEGFIFNLVKRETETYKAYKLHFNKDYNYDYLGFSYKDKWIAPHIKGQAKQIIGEFSSTDELKEILEIIEKKIFDTNNDINSIVLEDRLQHKYIYRNYDGMFEGNEVFNHIGEVVEDFNKLT